ncbi:MAG: hypothetical protein EA424_27245, partial [Planctomycetaceae bacterium]
EQRVCKVSESGGIGRRAGLRSQLDQGVRNRRKLLISKHLRFYFQAVAKVFSAILLQSLP